MKELFGTLVLCAIVVYLWCTSAPEQPTLPDASQRQGPTTGSKVTGSHTTGVTPVTSDGTLANRWPGAASNPTNGAAGQKLGPSGGWSTPSFQTNPFQTTTGGSSASRWSAPSFQINPFQTTTGNSPASQWSTPSFQTNPFQTTTPAPSGAPIGHWPTPSFQSNPFQTAKSSPSPGSAGQSPAAEDPSLASRWKNEPK